MVEAEILRSIGLNEFSNLAWTHKTEKRKLAPNVLRMIDFSNSVILWVATEIVTTPNLKKRIAVLRHLISVASVRILDSKSAYHLFLVLLTVKQFQWSV